MQQLRPHGIPLASPKTIPLTPKPLNCVLQATDSGKETESMAQHGTAWLLLEVTGYTNGGGFIWNFVESLGKSGAPHLNYLGY